MSKSSVHMQEPSGELQQKIVRARVAVSSQKKRYLLCPYCKRKAVGVYEDTRGHVETKCTLCGRITTFDVLSMRRVRHAAIYHR